MGIVATWIATKAIAERAGADGHECCAFSTQRELEALLATRRMNAVLVPLGIDGIEAVRIIGRVSAQRAITLPLIAYVSPTRLAYDQLFHILASGLNPRLAFQTGECRPLTAEFARLRSAVVSGSGEYLLSQFGDAIPRELAPILVPAIAIGGKRASAGALEATSRVPGRTIRQTLKSAGLATPIKVLGLVMGFNVTYCADVLGMSLSHVARYSNFDSEDAMRHYLRARTGLAPIDWRRMGVRASQRLFAQHCRISEGTSKSAEIFAKS